MIIIKKKYRTIGCMSGTSLDGLDLVLADFHLNAGKWSYQMLKAVTLPYEDSLRKKIRITLGRDISDSREEIENQYSIWLGEKVKEFIRGEEEIDLISIHGQTIYHNPLQGKTIQIGNGQMLADMTGLPVVNDFRSKDVELGGQGAPLVPVGDLHLFPDYKYCLNLGGIANVSIKEDRKIRAWDVCICNAGANSLVKEVGMEYDEGGKLGRKGKVLPALLKSWNSLDYFSKVPPKSLDASFFEKEMRNGLSKFGSLEVSDLLRTLYEHISMQLARSIENKEENVLVSGGGAWNDYLIELCREKGLKMMVEDRETTDFKEALIFAFLGVLKVRNEVNVLKEVTGSKEDHSAGRLCLPQL